MKKLLIAILTAFILIVVGGYLGYERYSTNKSMEPIRLSVKSISLRTNNALKFSMDTGKATFKEFFDKMETDITEIEKKILEIQIAETQRIKAKSDVAIAYAKQCQDVLRAELAYSRRTLVFTSALKRALDAANALQEANKSNSTPNQYVTKMYDSTKEEKRKAETEYKESKDDLSLALNSLIGIQEMTSTTLGSDVLIDVAVIQEARAKLNK